MGLDELSPTSLLYLFALEWLPVGRGGRSVAVPGGSVVGNEAYANLVHAALWDLQRRGLIELEQLRPAQEETVRVMGGASNVAVHVRHRTAATDGLERQVLEAAQQLGPPTGGIAGLTQKMSGDHDLGLRRLLAVLSNGTNRPFGQLASPCYDQLSGLGLVRRTGRLVQKVVIADRAGVEALRPRFDELRAERSQFVDEHLALTHAVIVDGIYSYDSLYSASSG